MEKAQRQALPSATTNTDSNSRSWFSGVGRTPPGIVGSPAVSGMPDVENHII